MNARVAFTGVLGCEFRRVPVVVPYAEPVDG